MLESVALGANGPQLSRVGLGCAPIGNLFTAVSDDAANDVVDAAWDAGVRYFDTAPLYGHGLSERRIGKALAGRDRASYVISTKVGRLLRPADHVDTSVFAVQAELEPVFDFSHDAVLRSVDESLERLGLDRIDVVYVHDPDDHEAEAVTGAFPALLRLRDEGVVRAIGCGMNQAPMLERFVDRFDLDGVLLAGRYTLLDQSGEGLLRRCAQRGIGVVIGGVFNSGVLARVDPDATFDYAPVERSVLERALELERMCGERGVSVRDAALRFALRHPAVTTVLVGARSRAEIETAIASLRAAIPESLWLNVP